MVARTKLEGYDVQMRKKLDDALRSVMLESSDFGDITVKKICDRAGVSTGHFYYYYKNKAEAVIHQLMYMDENYLNFVEDNRARTGAERLHAYYRIYVQEAYLSGKSMWKGFLQSLYSDGSFLDDLDSLEYYGLLVDVFRQGIQSGEFAPLFAPEELARNFFVTMRGMVYHWACTKQDYDLEHSLGVMVDTMVTGLARQQTP